MIVGALVEEVVAVIDAVMLHHRYDLLPSPLMTRKIYYCQCLLPRELSSSSTYELSDAPKRRQKPEQSSVRSFRSTSFSNWFVYLLRHLHI